MKHFPSRISPDKNAAMIEGPSLKATNVDIAEVKVLREGLQRKSDASSDSASFSQEQLSTLKNYEHEKLFICSYPGCGEFCSSKKSLKSHLFAQGHSEEIFKTPRSKPFVCFYLNCGKSFCYERGLCNHLSLKHNVRNCRAHNACNYPGCETSYTENQRLKYHCNEQGVLEECKGNFRAFVCLYTDCGKAFKRWRDLNAHQKADEHFQ